MGTYNIHAGHCPQGKGASGAVGLLKESVEDRAVKNELLSMMKAGGHTAYDCTCDVATTQSGCLAKIVAKCNQHSVDADVSIHLNSGRDDEDGDGKTGGVEVWVYSKNSKVWDMAERICEEVSKELGVYNRGVKVSTELYVLRKTNSPALLVECCFVDDMDDFKAWNANRCAAGIYKGITGKTAVSSGSVSSGSTSKPAGNSSTAGSTSSVSYYPAFSDTSIVEGLQSIGVDSSMASRKKIAAANGISNYSGTSEQNTKLCNLAKQGKLKKAGSTASGSSSTSSTSSSGSSYKVGGTYTLQSNMIVRTGAGTNYRAKKHSELTADGQKHDKDKNGCLDKGTRVTCKAVKVSGSKTWIQTPSGWICAKDGSKVYVK